MPARPMQNSLPAPRSTITCEVLGASRMICVSSTTIGSVMPLPCSGRLMVMRRIGPSCCVKSSLLMSSPQVDRLFVGGALFLLVIFERPLSVLQARQHAFRAQRIERQGDLAAILAADRRHQLTEEQGACFKRLTHGLIARGCFR